jgi:transcriptional regulator with XRE-family HTH domain
VPGGAGSVGDMSTSEDRRSEVRDFLRSRRDRVAPGQAGLLVYGQPRRVPGLRREEVALLAGISVDYYARMERGNLTGVSASILDAVARVLRLDEAEREHLLTLARHAGPAGRRAPSPRGTANRGMRPALGQLLDAVTGAPAYVRNGRHDMLAANGLARALFTPMLDDRRQPPNSARFVYLDPRSRDFFTDWDRAADDIAAILRSEAARSPHDRALTDLIGELATRSQTFRTRWAAHKVRVQRSGRKQLRHPVVGLLDLNFEAMELPADPGLALIVCPAQPGTPSADSLALLASWGTTQERDQAPTCDQGTR